MKITIGKHESRNVSFDLDVLLTTRLLITANSGAGKSWLLRKLMEEFAGHIQVIAIDPEGEFASLREKFDYSLVGPGGEIPADTRIAGDVAEKLLELRLSAVCDLYEMKSQARHEWVRNFLDALVNAPKKLWHPAIVIVDEAQMFCPESKAGESVATGSMIDLATKGRKRGFCAVWATQKLSNLQKTATTNMLNRLVGGTFEDVDVKRALDLLSVAPEDKREIAHQLRTLESGQFYAFGRAIAKERLLIKVGPVQTTHPEPGKSKHVAEPPPPPEKIKAVLAKLAEIPHQAEEKARTVADYQRQVRELKGQLAAAKRAQPPPAVTTVKPVNTAKLQAEFERRTAAALKARDAEWKRAFGVYERALAAVSLEWPKPAKVEPAPPLSNIFDRPTAQPGAAVPHEPKSPAIRATPPAERSQDLAEAVAANNGHITRSQEKILAALAEFEAIGRPAVPKKWIAALAGASHSSSAFGNNLGALRSAGLIDYPQPGTASLTDEGRGKAPAADPPASSQEMLERCKRITSSSQAEMLEALAKVYPNAVPKEQLAEMVEKSATSSAFGNNLGALRSAGMIEYPSPRTAKLAGWVMLEDAA